MTRALQIVTPETSQSTPSIVESNSTRTNLEDYPLLYLGLMMEVVGTCRGCTIALNDDGTVSLFDDSVNSASSNNSNTTSNTNNTKGVSDTNGQRRYLQSSYLQSVLEQRRHQSAHNALDTTARNLNSDTAVCECPPIDSDSAAAEARRNGSSSSARSGCHGTSRLYAF